LTRDRSVQHRTHPVGGRLFDAFESIQILNLPHRSDRRREMLTELAKFGLAGDERVSFFAGSMKTDPGPFSSAGEHGCYLSHLALLRGAAAAGKTTLVLEDDCDFLPEAADYVLPDEWDIFCGGYTADDPDNLETSNIIGAHCMGYSPRASGALAAYLERLLEPDFEPDPLAVARGHYTPGVKPPFDGAIVWFRRANPEMKTVFAQIAIQRSSRSDIAAGNLLDRTLPAAASAARKAKNWLRKRAR
jgi:glycosyl transferase, family 25